MKKIFLFSSLLFLILFFQGCEGTEYHHVFPQQFRSYFATKGINVDDYTIAITTEDHRGKIKGLHSTGWNQEWALWLQKHPNATKKQIMSQLEKMLNKRGFVGEFNFYNYRTKKVTGKKIQLVGSGFLGYFASIGKFIMKWIGINSMLGSFFVLIGTIIFGFFGIKASSETKFGVGFVVLVIIVILLAMPFLAFIAQIYPELYSILVFIIIGIIFLMTGVSVSSSDVDNMIQSHTD